MHQRINRLLEEYRNNVVSTLNEEYFVQTRLGNRVSDKLAAFGGSWGFIFSFAALLLLWIMWNISPGFKHFDPAPFILLNLVLSFLAGFQAPFIMMAQNRQAARDKNEADIDFAINYKSELEVEDIQDHLHSIEERLDKFQQSLEEIKLLMDKKIVGD